MKESKDIGEPGARNILTSVKVSNMSTNDHSRAQKWDRPKVLDWPSFSPNHMTLDLECLGATMQQGEALVLDWNSHFHLTSKHSKLHSLVSYLSTLWCNTIS